MASNMYCDWESCVSSLMIGRAPVTDGLETCNCSQLVDHHTLTVTVNSRQLEAVITGALHKKV
jgi:hypothetical protein